MTTTERAPMHAQDATLAHEISDLMGKNILILGSTLWGYADVAKQLIRGGGCVEWYDIPCVYGSIRNPLTTDTLINMVRTPCDRTKKTKALIEKFRGRHYDIVLFWSTSSYGKTFLEFLRQNNPGVKIFLFLCDTLKDTFPRYNDYFPLFNRVYTFDKDDANRHGFAYQPNPVIDINHEGEQKYDISFVGSVHKHTRNRPALLRFVQEFCQQNHLTASFYLLYQGYKDKHPSLFKRFWRRVVDGSYNKEIEAYRPYGFMHDEPLPLSEIDRMYNQSKVILDINHPGRQGMTINCLAALGKGKKLITTNARIREEPFYDPSVIYILDENNPYIAPDFINSPYTPADVEYLRIDNWLYHVLGLSGRGHTE